MGWKACGGVKMGCIMTPMPNHLSTHLSLFYYSSFDEWGRVGMVRVRRMVRSVDEMVRIQVDKGDMTTPMVWIRADER